MGFKEKLASGVKKHLGTLKKAYDNRVAIAEQNARRDLAKAQTKSQQEQVMLKLKREKMKAKQELYEAKVATQKAKASLEKARKEAGDLTISERLAGVGKQFGSGLFKAYKGYAKSYNKPASKRRTTKSKTTRRK